MKSKIILLVLAGLLAGNVAALAQTEAPATDTNTPATATTSTNVTTNVTTTVTSSVTTNVAPAAATNAAADATAPAPAPAPAATPDASAAAAAPAASNNNNSARDPNAVIPLIVMDEVPLTDAIKNLARQAGLNYMLDPKINYGGVGANGQPVVQPLVSLRWENLTPDQALLAVLNNYNLVIVDDPKTKISRITIKDPAAPDPLVSSIIQLKYATPSNILGSVQTVLVDKRSRVVADLRTAQLVILCTDKELDAVTKLIESLDTPTKQVLIEARLVESSKNPTTSKGVDWTGTFGAQHVSFGNNAVAITPATGGTPATTTTTLVNGVPQSITTPGTPAQPAFLSELLPGVPESPTSPLVTADTHGGFNPQTFFLNADGASAVLSFLNSDNTAEVLATPRAVTLDNQTAVLEVTTAQPIFASTAGTQGSPGGASVSYTNVGTILTVTPHISANNTVALKVVPEVSDVGGTITKTVAGVVNQADFFEVRRIETQVLIPSGNTLVMGGLVSDTETKGNIKVPVLGDIPILGHAFQSQTKTQLKKVLTIFLTPTIVQTEDFQPNQTDFLKKHYPKDTASDFGPWDSGEPQDWSKLIHSHKSNPAEDNSN